MAANSFVLKGWSVTLVTGLFALAADGGRGEYAALGLVPAVSFWWLDAYYLRLERLFRKLHDDVRHGGLASDLYSMSVAKYDRDVASTARIMWSPSVRWLHAVVVAVVVVVTVFLLLADQEGKNATQSTGTPSVSRRDPKT
jgi:hypothetical protein